MNWGEIDNMWAFGAVIAGLVANQVTVMYGQRKARNHRLAQRRQTDMIETGVVEVREQIRNDHPEKPNLRDDIDELKALLSTVLQDERSIRLDVGGLRKDLGHIRGELGDIRGEVRDGRGEHTHLEQRIREFVQRVHPDAEPL